MIQIYVDGALVSDSRNYLHTLYDLSVTASLTKGGTAEIVLPSYHPAYDSFPAYKPVVEIYRSSRLIFRGRPLYTSDDFNRVRTVTCEGERCFLRDAIMRPYLYQTDPKSIFEDIISIYNSQVEDDKQFLIGDVTVTDSNDYVRLECGTAETVFDTIDKLLERCGGYILFSNYVDGRRKINWYATVNYYCMQSIDLGSNLLDFVRNSSNTDLATVIIPYGAPVGDTGERLTIRTVNNGLDYIEDADAIALRGRITKAVYFDDVTEPANLLKKANDYMAKSKLLVTTLQLSAVDLSDMDMSIETFVEGEELHVRSLPHGIDADFLLMERTYHLDPTCDTITLGMDVSTLTGVQSSSDRKASNVIDRVERSAKSDYKKNKALIEGTETRLASMIKQTSDSIVTEVSKQQEDIDSIRSELTRVEQTAAQLSAVVRSIEEDGVSKVTTETGATLDKDGLHITKSGEEMESRIDYSGLHVERNDVAILEATAAGVEAENVKVRTYLIVGQHARFEDYANERDASRTACYYI